MYNEEDYLQLSGIQHYAYCPRQWALAYLEQQWTENLRTFEGRVLHEHAHDGSSSEKRGDIISVRGMRVFSRVLGISGECDVVEFHLCKAGMPGIPINGRQGLYKVVPIEYKRGKPKEHNADQLQLCAQAMCIEEMLVCEISVGYLFYGEVRRRTEVEFCDSLRKKVVDSFAQMQEYFKRGYTPQVKPRKGCNACSLNGICVPKMSKYTNKTVRGYITAKLGEAEAEDESGGEYKGGRVGD